MTQEEFFNQTIPEPNSGCWFWMKSTARDGYGLVSIGHGKRVIAHRFSWELHNGQPIPDKMLVCHRCDIPNCVNPDHLFLGDHSDNFVDAVKKSRVDPGAHLRRKTHCPSGHPYAGWNLISYQGRRYCRACMYRHTKKARI